MPRYLVPKVRVTRYAALSCPKCSGTQVGKFKDGRVYCDACNYEEPRPEKLMTMVEKLAKPDELLRLKQHFDERRAT